LTFGRAFDLRTARSRTQARAASQTP